MTIWNGLTSDGAVVPIQVDDQGRVVAVGSGPDSPLVVDGDYLRPRDPALGLGTANINLDADGTASFAGIATFGNDPMSGNSTGVRIFNQGAVYVTNNNGNSPVYSAFTKGNSDPTVDIRADGTAAFAGAITSGSTDINSTTERGFYAEPGAIQCNQIADAGNTNPRVFIGKLASNISSEIFSDGSATFAGDVVTGTFNPSSNGTFGIELGVDGACSVQRLESADPGSVVFRGLLGAKATTLITAKGDATFSGNVNAANIQLFSVVLKAAVRNSTTLDELKKAIVDALTELVPPDVTPDVSTMPTPDA